MTLKKPTPDNRSLKQKLLDLIRAEIGEDASLNRFQLDMDVDNGEVTVIWKREDKIVQANVGK